MALINNAHYLVEVFYRTNSCGGGNPTGYVVRVYQKRTLHEIEVPLSVWVKIVRQISFWIKNQVPKVEDV